MVTALHTAELQQLRTKVKVQQNIIASQQETIKQLQAKMQDFVNRYLSTCEQPKYTPEQKQLAKEMIEQLQVQGKEYEMKAAEMKAYYEQFKK